MLKSIADIVQPCLTPVFTSKLILLLPTLHMKSKSSWWCRQSALLSIGSTDASKTLPLYAIKSLLEVYKVDVELPLPFCALFNDVVQGKDLVYASLSFLEPCLYSSQLVVHCQLFARPITNAEKIYFFMHIIHIKTHKVSRPWGSDRFKYVLREKWLKLFNSKTWIHLDLFKTWVDWNGEKKRTKLLSYFLRFCIEALRMTLQQIIYTDHQDGSWLSGNGQSSQVSVYRM